MSKNSKTSKPVALSERQIRVLIALMQTYGWIWREHVDAIAGASNGPDVIMRLIRKGIDIEMQRADRIDRDGKPCKPGRYRLTAVGREKAKRIPAELLRRRDAEDIRELQARDEGKEVVITSDRSRSVVNSAADPMTCGCQPQSHAPATRAADEAAVLQQALGHTLEADQAIAEVLA